jgi:lipopolysaccharide transport protein LptA
MAASNRSWRRLGPAVSGLLLLALPAGSGAEALGKSDLPINLEAASTDFDYKNNSLVFKRVRITQGEMQVDAEEARATGLNFDNSEWELKGDVRITVRDGNLSSDEATVTFRNNEILRAVIVGDPASFEQKLRESQQLARGRADKITYDVKASTVQLNGDAWLTDGQNQIEGATLIYNIGEQRVAANPNATTPGGVKITINPRSSDTTGTNPQPPRNDQPPSNEEPPPQDRTP